MSMISALNRTLGQTAVTILLLLGGSVLSPVCGAAPSSESGGAHALTLDQLGSAAARQYHGDGLAIEATAEGAQLRCRFQRLEGQATPEGLWLTSTVSNQAPARFCLRAAAVGRDDAAAAPLATRGAVHAEAGLARWIRPGLTEEYAVSPDGVRQDFLVPERPAGGGALHVELSLAGARAAGVGGSVQLVLDGSGRTLVYSRLQAVDAQHHELAAHFVVTAPDRLAVVVDDAQAVYPVRIDPTYSDANWTSLGGYNGVNGGISAVVVDGTGSIYAGGTFTVAGTVAANNVAKWDGNTWSPLGPGVNNAVYALALDAGGNLYVGGNFSTAGGVFSPYLARWDGTNWWSMGAGVNGMVRALLASGTTLYAGGDFTMAGGNAVAYMAKWNGTTWSSAGAGFDSSVYALVADGAGNIYAGGGFFGAGSFIAHSIAKWDGIAWSPLGQGVNATVYALAISGTNLYAGGNFTSAGTLYSVEYVAKWNGSAWSKMGTYGLNYPVKSLAADGSGNVYAGGMFLGELAGTNANYIAKWDGGKWSSLGAGVSNGADSYVQALAVSGTNLIAAGGFTAMGGKPTGGLAIWNGTAWSTPTADMNAAVLAMVLDGSGNLYAGGSFTSAGGNTVNHVARWNGSAWLPVGSGLGSRPGLGFDQTTYEAVTTLAMDGSGNLYAGGSFTNAGSLAITNVAKWNGSTWSNLGTGLGSLGQYGSVYKLAWDGTYSTLYAVGGFARAGSGGYTNVAKWNGTAWSGLGSGLYYKPGYSSSGNALAVSGTNVYVGGTFWVAGGVNATNIAKWNGSTWSSLGPGINTSISALAVDGTYVYAAGMFSSLNGVAATNIARWNGSVWSALGSGVNNAVSVMTVSGGTLYAGGTFTMAGGNPANDVAQWNGSAWSPLGPGVGGGVSALAVDAANNLYVGGGFLSAGGKVAGGAACLMATASPAVDTALALSATPNPAPYAQPVNLIAAVTNLGGASTPYGNVVFLEAGTPLGTSVLYGSGPRATAVFSPTNLTLGLHTITAAYAGNGTFNASTSTCDVTITQGWQTITFRPIADQVTTAQLGLQATASSGLPVTFAVVSGPATISNGTNLSFSGTGVVAIAASQAGNANYNPAPDVTNTFAVRAQFALTVANDFGTGMPSAGVHTNFYGTVLTNSVTTPWVQNGTQYVCAGWSMSGNAPASGQSNSLVMTLTNNAVLTWLWTTNPPCALTIISAHGTATPGTGVRTNFFGTVLTNSVTSPVMQNGTQYVCVGWTLGGNDPATGTTNRMVMTQTNNAVLTWIWITNPPPKLSVTPSTLDFGTVVVGQTAMQPFFVVNIGGQTLTGSAWSYGGAFSVDPGSSSYSLAAGQTGTVWATCTPPWASPFSGTIQFDSNGGTSVNQVEATAIWPGWLRAWSEQSVDLGVLATGTTAQATFTLINYGDAPISASVAPPDAPFAVASESAFTLDGWATTNVVINFTPLTAGAFSADVVISSTGGDVTNTVTGTGAIPYTLVIAPSVGGCTPPPGTYTNFAGTVLTNTALSYDDQGSVHYVCQGWTMTGNEPVSGTGTCVVMTVTNDAVLTWIWATNYWNGPAQYWSGNSINSDAISEDDNWSSLAHPGPGDSLYFVDTGSRHEPTSNYGADSYFGEIVSLWNTGGMTWRGDKTSLLRFENRYDDHPLIAAADLANRMWPDSDLQINPYGSGGVIVGNVDLQNGRQLQVYGGNTLTVNGALTQSGSGDATLAIYDGATVVLNGANLLTGAIALGNGTLVCGGSGAQTWANAISGAGGLAKQGAGTLTLSGLNGFAGGVRIDAGLLLLGSAGAIPDASALTLTGGALDLNGQALTVSSLAGTGGVITNSGGVLTVDEAADTTFGGTIAGTGSLIKRGAGTLALGGSNIYSGETRIEGGTLNIPAGLSSHLLHRWSFNNGDLSDAVGGQAATLVQGTDVHATLAATQVTLPGGGWGAADYISLGSNILPNGADAPATIELWATQQSVQTWSRIFDFGIDSGNYLEMPWSAGDDINSDFVEVTGQGGVWNSMAPYDLGVEYHIAMVITPGAGDGGQTLLQWYKMDAAGTTLRTGSMSLNWTLADLVQENMWLGVDKWGSTCANASYNEVRIWDTALTEAQLAVNSVAGPDVLPVAPTLPAATAVTIANGSVLDLSGAVDQTVASIASTDGLGSQITLGSASLTVGDATITTFDGVISGAGDLIKHGPGVLVLAGANTYGGATSVGNGALFVAGAIGPGAVTVASGATLGGTGVVSGGVVSDGTVVLGDDANIRALELPSYEQHAGATLKVKIGGVATPGVDFDQLSVSGTANLSGLLHVTLASNFMPALGDTFAVVQAGAGLSGTFAGIDALPIDTTNGLSWYLTYDGTSALLQAVHQDDQTIAFDPIGDLEWTTPYSLQATASSGLPVTFAVVDGPALLSDGTNLTFTGAGPVTVVATQPGNISYHAAPPVTNTFNVFGWFTLSVVSDHGAPSPAAGDASFFSGTVLTNQVTPLDIQGNTHYVCTGWTLSGNNPASGTGTSMVMTVWNDAVLTWLWSTSYWNGAVQNWTGEGATSDTIDQDDNWTRGHPNPGDNLSFSNTTGSRHNPRSNYGADSYFGELIAYDGAGGITWSGDRTALLKLENNSDANPLVFEADLANRTGPDSDLAINPVGGGITVSNVDLQNGRRLLVNGASTLTVSGALTQSGSGDASLAMSGGGTVVLNGPDRLTGSTLIDGGTLQIGSGGTAGELGGGPVVDNGTLSYDRSDAQTWTNGISGAGSLVKQGAGMLTLGGQNTYSGETRIAGGALQLMPVLAPHLIHRWSFNGDLRDTAGGQTAVIVAGSVASATLDSQQVTLPGGNWGESDTISLGSNILPQAAGAPATIELWATQQAVQRWSRIFDFGNDLGNYLMMSWCWEDDPNGDRLEVHGLGGDVTVDGTMAPYELGVEYHIAVVLTPGAGDAGQNLLQWYKMDASGATLNSGTVSIAGDLSQLVQNNMWLGASEWGSYGDQNAHASYNEVRIWDVALTETQLAANALLGPDALPIEPLPALVSPLPATTAVTLCGGGVLDLSNLVAQTVASLAATDGSGSQIRLHAANLTVGDATSTTFDGVLSGSAAVTKSGAGTLTLTGANTYDGATVINQGALVVNGSIATGGVMVDSGATLAGRGSAAGTVVSDGAVAPGDDGAIGALGLARYVQHGGATLNIRIAGAQAPGADYDHLSVGGDATLDGTLNVTLVNGYMPTTNDQFVVLQAGAGISGVFAATNLPPLGAGLGWNMTYGSDFVVLQPVVVAGSSRAFTLEIVSAYGSAAPAPGLYADVPFGTVLTNSVATPDTQGSTQYVCMGWVLSGNEPASGSEATVVMTVTNDAVLTWVWSTNYWLATAAGSHGAVTTPGGWQAAGSTVAVTAQADRFYHFTNWTGNVSGDGFANPASLLMDAAKAVAAQFAENVTAGHGTPEWWLDAHYPGTVDFEAAALADTDGDGVPAWAEYIADTDPNDAASYFHILTATELADRTVVSFQSSSNRVYGLAGCTDLTVGAWLGVAGQTNIPGTGGIQTFEDTDRAAPQRFHQLQVALP